MKNLKTLFFDLKQGCVLSESEEDECEEFFGCEIENLIYLYIQRTISFSSVNCVLLYLTKPWKSFIQRKETKDQVWVLKQGSVLKQEDSILERWKKMTTKRKALGISEKKVEKDVNEKEGSSLTLGIKR